MGKGGKRGGKPPSDELLLVQAQTGCSVGLDQFRMTKVRTVVLLIAIFIGQAAPGGLTHLEEQEPEVYQILTRNKEAVVFWGQRLPAVSVAAWRVGGVPDSEKDSDSEKGLLLITTLVLGFGIAPHGVQLGEHDYQGLNLVFVDPDVFFGLKS